MIDRHAVVSRHNVRLTAPDALTALTVGNGEFAYTMDVTGLQTLTALHDEVAARAENRPAMGLHTQAQWGFHEMSNPDGWDLADVMRPYRTPHGVIDYPVAYDFDRPPAELTQDELPGYYLWVNPQRLDLFRLGLELRAAADDEPLAAAGLHSRLTDVDQQLDLWSGTVVSRFSFQGTDFRVTTACHPDRDLLAFKIESEQLTDGRATLVLSFPGASDTFADTADWRHPERHHTELTLDAPVDGRTTARLDRRLDGTGYTVDLATSPGARLEDVGVHRYRITADGPVLEVIVAAAPTDRDRSTERTPLPRTADVFEASAAGWRDFWTSGAAVDLSGCTDPRAHELERRIVLSQYLTRTQSAGSLPPAETGLTQNSWAGKFHLEMHWWHAAHFASWGRPELLERSLDWYRSILPVARQIAARQGFPGVRWPKHIGPEGRESPNVIGPLLVWQQPHPIHFAELIRLARPTEQPAVLDRYGELVEQTARFIAGYLYRTPDGLVHLPPATMPAQERYQPEEVWDPPFELCYFAWGLRTAQTWRELRGLERETGWDALLVDLAPLPIQHDHYAAVGAAPGSAAPPRTELGDHPSMVGALGLVPETGLVDPDVMRSTLDFIDREWDWDLTWGWDYPMIAMTATRLGDPDRAVEALTRQAPRNRYLANGHNCQHPTRLPLYLPGNGGLLSAVALMITGAGSAQQRSGHPGFPNQGWQIRAEGFPQRP
ncbi:hypothetical protein FOE78_15305 [Microlunatus elymi]|uniref:Glycosyl hydrolase family 65, N-terminal domain n=1 Tax=Microlunatus elymi TaxID=2596828 RepID=A0A516Q1M4_9ACTN|nr:hypothetical protein [Microlunatus elymi]QDP97111.1 hypothetical protein FOE78_15305 [Microlunatus elymi]